MRYAVHYSNEFVKTEFVIVQCLTRTNILNDGSSNFLQQFYSLLPTEYKKNLKKVIMFHYGVSNRALLTITSSYMSPRFMRKLEYADSIKELHRFLPDISEEELLNRLPFIVKHDDAELLGSDVPTILTMNLMDQCICNGYPVPGYGDIPAIIVDIIQKLSKPDFIIIPNLLSLQTSADKLNSIIGEVNSGVPFRAGDSDPSALVSVFKLLLNSMDEPLLGSEMFHSIVNQCKSSGTNELAHSFYINLLKDTITKLPDCIKFVIKFIVDFLHLISTKSSTNNMTAHKIAEILAPSFCRPTSMKNNIMYQSIPPCVECITVLITDCQSIFNNILPEIKLCDRLQEIKENLRRRRLEENEEAEEEAEEVEEEAKEVEEETEEVKEEIENETTEQVQNDKTEAEGEGEEEEDNRQ
ncbi:Sec14D and RhoGAP domain-containing protein [Cryptosporidium canis]|uniref:Sec14D and RhoGAP domain-containing protein n=1 Tax=Cryptosporidium canis TaxID=195482 RepID=A0ABQ8P5D4_9CRYT|nr:Sec14D and RhoGAP domain-containing protein [Cryptosporidium canis]KAJ1613437.1 Sec14D and RhoGAP domain-containing protein [Cryptosporidium canis]